MVGKAFEQAMSTEAAAELLGAFRRELSSEDGIRLTRAVQELSMLRDVAGVAEVVRRWARELTEADGVTFVLRDGESCFYADENAIAPLWKGRRFPSSSCISGWAMSHREAVIIPDIYEDPRVPIDAYRPTFVKSLAMVPVREEEPVAAIGAYWATPHTATAREMAILQTIANATSTALANAELLLQVDRARHRFEKLTELGPQLVWTAGPDGDVRYVNARWREYTGLSDDESRGRGWTAVVHPEDLGPLLERWRQAVAGDLLYEMECRMRRASDGEYRWMLVRAVRLKSDPLVQEWVGACTDIHAQKESEKEKEEAIRLRDEFLSVAGHELRTPVTALLLNLDSAAARGRPADEVVERLMRARGQTERLIRLVDDLLDISRFAMGRFDLHLEAVSLSDVVNASVDRLADAAKRASCEIKVTLDDRARGEWDRHRLEQALENLLNNAFKFGPGKPVDVIVRAEPSHAVLIVRDHGIGIAPADQRRIFAKFARAVSDRNYGGFGLGLWIVCQIVEGHHGTITVESEPGKGATFTIQLPFQVANQR